MPHPRPLAAAARLRVVAWLTACALAVPLAGCGGGGDTAGAAVDAGKLKQDDSAALKKGDDGSIKLRRVRRGTSGQ
jgi:hypothetical protein